MTVGDFDQDGKADLAVANIEAGVGILLGNGDGTFQPAASYAAGSGPQVVAVGDFNGDGRPDLAVASQGGAGVLLGNGDGTFQPLIDYGVGLQLSGAAVGDFNGDGRTDLVVVDGGYISVLLGVEAPDLTIATSHAGNFAHGQTGASYSITVGNVGVAPTVGEVTVTDGLEFGLAATAITGAGWNCTQNPTVACSRSDVLSAGASYPPIALNVNTGGNGSTNILNIAMVSGGGEFNLANDTSYDTVTLSSVPPALAFLGNSILPVGSVGAPYYQSLPATGGIPPYVWSVASGALPDGLSLSADGVIAGTPSAQTIATFTVQLTDNASASITQMLFLTIQPAAPVLGPLVFDGGVLNAASYAKDPNGRGIAVAPGSLVQIYGHFPGAIPQGPAAVPFPLTLGGVDVTFNGIAAPLSAVAPNGNIPIVNAQIPFELLAAGQTSAIVNVVVKVNGVASPPQPIAITSSEPGVFTIPPDGRGNAILVFVDPADEIAKIAAPASASVSFGYPTSPILRGTAGFFYVTGLGKMTPPITDGNGGLELPFVTHRANAIPIVMIGDVPAIVQFAGQAPGYPGVNQINVVVPANAPVGDAVTLTVQTADGLASCNVASIAIR